MRLQSWQRGVSLGGRQVYLSLLVVLFSHLLVMVTPLHDVVVSGHRSSHEPMAMHAAHAAPSGCVAQSARATHSGYDCAIQGNTPTRSAFGLLLESRWSSLAEPLRLAGLMPVPLERSTWPPPLPDLQVLFQVFRM